MIFQLIEDRELQNLDAVQQREIGGRDLEKRELVALVILRDRESQRGPGIMPASGQYFDQQIDVAVGLGPVARGIMQPVTHIGCGIQSIDGAGGLQGLAPQHAADIRGPRVDLGAVVTE